MKEKQQLLLGLQKEVNDESKKGGNLKDNDHYSVQSSYDAPGYKSQLETFGKHSKLLKI